jgi:hypothetical protein
MVESQFDNIGERLGAPDPFAQLVGGCRVN